MKLVVGALVWGAMVTMAGAATGQCSVTGYGTFDCDVTLDGGGLTFDLPDGQTLAFALTEADLGVAYLISADAAPGALPTELHEFRPIEGEAGCWESTRADYKFCAAFVE